MRAVRAVCARCKASVIRADCFDGKARKFDLTPVSGAAEDGPGHEAGRWWFTRSRGMVSGAVCSPAPREWHVQHRCAPVPFSGLPDELGAHSGPAAGDVFAGYAVGYRWPVGPAHVTTTWVRGVCGARLSFGEAPREAARAAELAPCPACARVMSAPVSPLPEKTPPPVPAPVRITGQARDRKGAPALRLVIVDTDGEARLW